MTSSNKSYKKHLKNITTFIFDVDGVFTDGTILINTDGEILRTMSVKDGYAIKIALQKGYNICIISGGTNKGVKKRFERLGVTDIYLGVHHKEAPLKDYLEAHKIKPVNVIYMGDDLPDIPPMLRVGLGCCPQDAVSEVKAISKYISHKNGGSGCVRDIIEQVLKIRGHWFNNFNTHYSPPKST